MKSTLITLTAVASLVGYTQATVTFKEPWSKSKAWKAGEKAEVKWMSDAADTDKMCDIQMLNGDKLNSNVVAMVTDPKAPVKCGANQFEIAPLNDFKSGEYWLRIGQASTNTWTYSAVFNFEGQGTVSPLKQADGTTHYPSAQVPKDGKNKQNDATQKGPVSSHALAQSSGSSSSSSVSKSASASSVPSNVDHHNSDPDNKAAIPEKKASGEGQSYSLDMNLVMWLVSGLAYALTG